MKFISKSEKETHDFAKQFASQLVGGEVLCLIGDLGAGKTAFTKGLAVGLGIKNIITSPTFVLMKNYKVSSFLSLPKKSYKTSSSSPLSKGRLGGVNIRHLAHIDAYRLTDGEQLLGIGSEDYFNQPECVTVIEWADRVKNIWPKKVIKVEFKILKGDKREIKIN